MSWFEEQLEQRKKADDEKFSQAIDTIAGAVMGKRLANALNSEAITDSAIDEILKFYHFKSNSKEYPNTISTVDEQLEYRMRPYGIMRRTVVLDKGWYRHAVGAMLGTLKEDGAAIALIPSKTVGYTYLDFRTGKRVKVNSKTEKLIDEQALCFYPPLPQKALTILDLLKFMLEQFSVSDIVIYLGLMAITAGLGLISPLFTKWLFGDVLESQKVMVLMALAGFMVFYSLGSLFVSVFKSMVESRIQIKQDIAVHAAVMNRIMSLPATFFKGFSSGELNQRSYYVQSLCSMIMATIGSVGISSVFSLVYLGQIFVFAPTLVLPSVLITLISVVLSTFTVLLQMKISKERMLVSSKTSGLVYSTISGIQKIKLSGAEKRMFSRWADAYAKEATYEYNPPVLLKLSSTINMTVSLVGSMILYAVAVKSGISVANYYAFNSSYAMVSGAFMSLISLATTIAEIKPILEMAKPIMEAEPEISNDRQIVTSLRGAIELSNVSFRYSDDLPWVIDDLSLKVKPGEFVAVVGPTGCGKSTLLRLLLGFEKPQKGTVYYDRKDLSKLDLKSLRQKIGTVMQDGKLTYGDIYSNIVISAPQLTLSQAWEAAETAAVAEDIKAMPMGMNTMICEGQGGISGGQKQRLMIARAIAPKPKILMFDEATSALDNITQKKVTEAIDVLNCTRIVIAHRLSTIRHADRIIYLKDGKVAEDGTYEELIAKDGLFAALVARQRIDVDAD